MSEPSKWAKEKARLIIASIAAHEHNRPVAAECDICVAVAIAAIDAARIEGLEMAAKVVDQYDPTDIDAVPTYWWETVPGLAAEIRAIADKIRAGEK